MKIILLENVKNLGKTGDVKGVSDGYARNFLLPRKLAEMATPEALKKAEKLKEQGIQKEKEELEKNQALADAISGKEIVIKSKEKDGKLFGSVGKKEIIKELKDRGIKIEEEVIVLDAPIKEIGEKEVPIKFEHGIETTIKVIIEGE
jgi:large subunit ribosomal protein L9